MILVPFLQWACFTCAAAVIVIALGPSKPPAMSAAGAPGNLSKSHGGSHDSEVLGACLAAIMCLADASRWRRLCMAFSRNRDEWCRR